MNMPPPTPCAGDPASPAIAATTSPSPEPRRPSHHQPPSHCRRLTATLPFAGCPNPATAGFTSPSAPRWTHAGNPTSGVPLSPSDAFRDYCLRNFHSPVFLPLSAASPLFELSELWVTPYPRLPSCHLAWMRNTLNYWLGGLSCVTQVSSVLFCVAIARSSIARFILTLGVLCHGPVKVLFFADAGPLHPSRHQLHRF